MRANQPKLAYYLASNHQLTAGANYADLEWLSGYISMVYLDAPDQSRKHFENFNLAVSSPISKARAGYWLGKVNEKYGQLEQAAKDYKVSANFQMTYYGQLSSERLKLNNNQSFFDDKSIFTWRAASFVDDAVFQAAVLLHKAEKFVMMRWFMTHMAETLDRDGLLRLSNYAHEKNVHFVEIGIAKEAAKRGIILPKAYFPINEIPTYSNNIPPEVILSIARRESELNMNAISPAGAIGLMQILPSTAKQMSKELGIKFSYKKLKSDAKYNVKLGSAYLSKLIDMYEGSYLLAFAAYNAGPRKVNEWIKLYGDPRDSLVSVINWVEHIPYKETRNYVMRVSESLHVYRIRINGSTPSVSLTKDLK
jgi:soluble lytic murein transglycosylase